MITDYIGGVWPNDYRLHICDRPNFSISQNSLSIYRLTCKILNIYRLMCQICNIYRLTCQIFAFCPFVAIYPYFLWFLSIRRKNECHVLFVHCPPPHPNIYTSIHSLRIQLASVRMTSSSSPLSRSSSSFLADFFSSENGFRLKGGGETV